MCEVGTIPVLTAGGMNQRGRLGTVPGLVLSAVPCSGALIWAPGAWEDGVVAFRGHPQSQSVAGLQQALGKVVERASE